MKTRCFSRAIDLAASLILLAGVLAVPARSNPATCSNATMAGTYLYVFSGFTYRTGPAISLTNASDPFVAAGRLILNGDGTGMTAQTINAAHKVTEQAFEVSYQVESDCRASISLNLCLGAECAGGPAYLAVAPDGSGAYAVNGIPRTTLSGQFLRVASGGCTESLEGEYRFETQGFGQTIRGAAPTAVSLAFTSAGITTATGGTLSSVDWMNLGGLVQPRMYASPYILNSDCIGGSAGGPMLGFRIYASGDGSVFVLIQTVAGAPVAGWYRQQAE